MKLTLRPLRRLTLPIPALRLTFATSLALWLAPAAILVLAPIPARAANTFTETGDLATARTYHTATLLPNGKVLVTGGEIWVAGAFPGAYLSSAELYDPGTGTWSATGALAAARSHHTATLLPNGKVLIAGGFDGANRITSAELYDPAAGTWSATGPLATARRNHTATLLTNGKVLVAGGLAGASYLSSAELYDPGTGTWSATGALAAARSHHTATLLPNGKVLVAAGYASGDRLDSAELYDPGTGTWSATGALAAARSAHTATLLPNGKVLVAAGSASGDRLDSAELYDPAAGTWSATGALSATRHSHTATLLPNGKVLVAGGRSGAPLASAELYDPVTGAWSATDSLAEARYSATTTLLPGGNALVAGGWNGGGGTLDSAELYDSASGAWSASGGLTDARHKSTAALLPDGNVLAAGGTGLGSAELYNPAAGTWSATGALSATRHSHTATLLPNGKVLAAGGGDTGGAPLASAELYDRATGMWTATGSLASARQLHTATLLPDGKVLVTGGADANGVLASAELYDPATGIWSATGALAAARSHHTATLLPNGKVLVAAGYDGGDRLDSAELFDPLTGLWMATGGLGAERISHSATLLPNGTVLVAGGWDGSTLDSAELYDPATGAWTPTASLPAGRDSHAATLLPNGRVLVAAGRNSGGLLATANLYDPAGDSGAGAWISTGGLAVSRESPIATLLPGGEVLIFGGYNAGPRAEAELYDSGLGFAAAWRPQIANSLFDETCRLILTGSGFRGVSGASGGNGSQDSPTDYPMVQVRLLDSGQSFFVTPGPGESFSDTGFVSGPVAPFFGHALITVIANGIPSESFVGAFIKEQTGDDFTVNTFDDHDDGHPGVDDCTLREAIIAANSSPGGSGIDFDPAVFAGMRTINLTSALPDLDSDLWILGPAAKVTVRRDSGGDYRIFSVGAGLVTLERLIVSNGSIPSGFGGGIESSGGDLTMNDCRLTDNASAGAAGGLAVLGGTLTMNRTTVSGNTCNNVGGIFLQDATATIRDSTISGNSGAWGEALRVFAFSTNAMVDLTNSTVSGNSTVFNNAGITAEVASSMTCTLKLTHCTVAGNQVAQAGHRAGIWLEPGVGTLSLLLKNSIVSGNTAAGVPADITGTADPASEGNLIGTGGGLTGGVNGNQVGVNDPMLGPLADNFGPTETRLPQSGSPAIDAGRVLALPEAADQRGVLRPLDGDNNASIVPDIGAFEVLPTLTPFVPGVPGGTIRPASASQQLTWNATGAPLYRFYFGTDENAVVNAVPGSGEDEGTQGGTSFDPPALPSGGTFFWRVDTVFGNLEIPGAVQSFGTITPQPDTRIGTKGNPTTHKEIAKVTLKGRRTGKLYASVRNDGDNTDAMRLSRIKANKTMKLKSFRLTGGRQNITAALKRGSYVTPALAPGEWVVIQTQAKAKGTKARQTLKYIAASQVVPAVLDGAKGKVKSGKK